MKRITDKDFVYFDSTTHSNPANFQERMKKYAATERSPRIYVDSLTAMGKLLQIQDASHRKPRSNG